MGQGISLDLLTLALLVGEYIDNMNEQTTNFDLRISKAQSEQLLRLSSSRKGGTEGMGFEIMCKEYGQDNRAESDKDWVALTEDDLDEQGRLSDDLQTFELWFKVAE